MAAAGEGDDPFASVLRCKQLLGIAPTEEELNDLGIFEDAPFGIAPIEEELTDLGIFEEPPVLLEKQHPKEDTEVGTLAKEELRFAPADRLPAKRPPSRTAEASTTAKFGRTRSPPSSGLISPRPKASEKPPLAVRSPPAIGLVSPRDPGKALPKPQSFGRVASTPQPSASRDSSAAPKSPRPVGKVASVPSGRAAATCSTSPRPFENRAASTQSKSLRPSENRAALAPQPSSGRTPSKSPQPRAAQQSGPKSAAPQDNAAFRARTAGMSKQEIERYEMEKMREKNKRNMERKKAAQADEVAESERLRHAVDQAVAKMAVVVENGRCLIEAH